MIKQSLRKLKDLHTLKALTIPAFATMSLFTSCATPPPTGPVAHRHGAIVHSHVLVDSADHKHATSGTTTASSKKKTSVATKKKAKTVTKITPAKPEDIKSPGLFHKHHNHIDPITGQSGVPC